MFYDNFERISRLTGKTPSGVCIRAGIDKNKASYWKQRNVIPTEPTMIKLADTLGCSVADFFQDPLAPQYSFNGTPKNDDLLDIYEQDFMHIYHSLTPRKRVALMELIYQFAESEGCSR